MRPPRVAYFPDSFHEVNGVAHTSRNFVAYAQRHGLPLLCVHAGLDRARHAPVERQQGCVTMLELPRSFASVRLEKDLSFDPLFWRHEERVADALHRFRPDLIHLTGPSELGIFAAYFAHRLHLTLAASWHTNVHEYAALRLQWLTRVVSGGQVLRFCHAAERLTLRATTSFYSQAQVLFAPNPVLAQLLTAATGRPCHLMQRGVDTQMFSPAHRTGAAASQPLTLGYVGRLSVEKNVALLPRIQQHLARHGVSAKFLIVGHGAEEAMLRREMQQAEFTGVLRGDDLSRAYARMDLLVFPSHTDTFGNVVLEALASGVPAIVTPSGGPRYIVQHGVTGLVVDDEEFAPAIHTLLSDAGRRATMGAAARTYALTCSWDAVFDRVYAAYPAQR